jgi:nucleoside-diphosphate-sugar epimerase
MTSVLVTGATGFIGRATLPLLAEAGYAVHAVHHTSPAVYVPGVRWHRCDLQEPGASAELMARLAPEFLLSLAWDASPGRFWTSDENMRWVESSVRLVRAFAAADGRRAVFAGSCAEYGHTAGPCSEDTTAVRPDTLYGACKNALSRVVSAHSREMGYSAAWARIFQPYGRRERPERLVPMVVRELLAGRAVDLTHGHQKRDFLVVDDVAAALVRLLASDVDGPINVGSGEATAVSQVATTIAAITGREGLVRCASAGGTVNDDWQLVADTTRLRQRLGWSPGVPLEDGLVATVEWWRDRV